MLLLVNLLFAYSHKLLIDESALEQICKLLLSFADYDFDEFDKPGAERSRRRRGGDDDLER